MSQGYAYDHAWAMERVRLAGLKAALDPHRETARTCSGWRRCDQPGIRPGCGGTAGSGYHGSVADDGRRMGQTAHDMTGAGN